MIRIFKILILFFMFTGNLHSNTNEKLYKKIDLFGEVLEKIKKEYFLKNFIVRPHFNKKILCPSFQTFFLNDNDPK